ncbi:hypothetical protein FSP39_008992 [Pinctada imbricata]|uniref:CUB domain-containing protein n=1 Tax=Pinctada imbricata TaxID=66713 RepID=A0AA88XW33_PINIB|nr:hypothetical protein FSP39_008992 [Pinctada imbricata]
MLCVVLTLCLITAAVGDRENLYKGGIITSPLYPSPYPPNQNKEWSFNQTVGKWILTIEDFELEESRACEKDYLEIIGKTEPERICGNLPQESHVTEGPVLVLKFKTDGFKHLRGFKLRITHSFDDADLKAKLEQIKKKNKNAAKAYLVDKETAWDKPWSQVLLYAILAIAVLIFNILLGCFVVGIIKRRREDRQRSLLVRNMQNQLSFTGSTGRRYSRGKMSFSKVPSRQPLSPTFSSQLSPAQINSPTLGIHGGSSYPGRQVFEFPQQHNIMA